MPEPQVSPHLRSSLHLFATLGNSTLCHFWFESSAAGLPEHAFRLKLWLFALSIPGTSDALELWAVEVLATVFETVKHRIGLRRLRVRRNIINITQFKIVVMKWNLGLVLGVLVWCGVTRRSLVSFDWVGGRMQFKRKKFRFRRTVWFWSLFLTHPTYGNKRVTTNDTHNSPRSRFSILKISGKVRVLKQSQSAVLCCVSHMTRLLTFTRVVKKSNEPSVCHKLWSILWPLVQVCSLTLECLVYQCVPNTHISGQFESMFLTILQQIPVLLWIGGHQGTELRLCTVAELFYQPACYTAPHISLHDLPYRRTMLRCLHQLSPNKVIFLLVLWRSWIRTYFLIVDNIFVCFELPLSAHQVDVVKEWCWFSQIDLFHQYFPHWIDVLFLSSQFYVVHIHRQE